MLLLMIVDDDDDGINSDMLQSTLGQRTKDQVRSHEVWATKLLGGDRCPSRCCPQRTKISGHVLDFVRPGRQSISTWRMVKCAVNKKNPMVKNG